MNQEPHIERQALLSSYRSILYTFVSATHTTQMQLDTICGWGQYIGIPTTETDALIKAFSSSGVQPPKDQRSPIEQLYYLTYMIYLDKVVDDCEIEILMEYAKHLGFPQHIIGDLMKAILTAPSDGVPAWQVKDELKDLLKASLE